MKVAFTKKKQMKVESVQKKMKVENGQMSMGWWRLAWVFWTVFPVLNSGYMFYSTKMLSMGADV